MRVAIQFDSYNVSIHAPLRSAIGCRCCAALDRNVSIHALPAERDM